jgi:CRP-like cAMP-binding protein
MPTTKEIVVLLSATEAFSGAPEDKLRELAEHFAERTVSEGEIVIEEDTLGQELFLVIDGLFQVLVVDEDDDGDGEDEETDVRLLQKGDVFGEIAVVTGGRRMATVRAASDGKLLVLDKADFQRVLQGSPEMVESICNSLARYFEHQD